MDLSIVIPAYNESRRLGPTLRRVVDYLRQKNVPYEVLVVDDGSSDDTSEVARQYEAEGVRVLRQEVNRGKGAVLKVGVLASRGKEVLLVDADLSTPIEDLEKLQPRLADAQVVLGSRAVEDSDIQKHQPFYREMMGRTFNLIVQAMGVRGLRDTQCGFKLLQGDVARRLFAELQIERFAYDVELVWLARRHGYRVVEVGVRWADSPSSKVNPLTDSVRMFWDVMALRWRHRRNGRRP
ncbi:MAG TPA: dolichyl-phosphate beta-glucosyltransferase [Thermoanaerobaculia bacterium]|jgi:dolichyl-phosphate beta-glucosyltransferase|nr:dolichyl-phosphate beta-glucosyltransferase [Thermoanaerobaculia bacterium]